MVLEIDGRLFYLESGIAPGLMPLSALAQQLLN